VKNILLIATYDSFLRTGYTVAKTINNAKIEIKIRLSTSNQLSKAQLESIIEDKNIQYSFFHLNSYEDIDLNNYDIIIISAGNSFHENFFKYYYESKHINRKNIVTITLFAGVIFGDNDSIVSRIQSDILLCNNRMDLDVARNIKNHYNLKTKVFLYGFPVIKKIDNVKKENIYFFEQVKMPATYEDRMYLIMKLIEFAFANPKEKIFIKPRVPISEKTIHKNKFPLEKIMEDYAQKYKIPSNLFFIYDEVTKCLSQAKLVLTISSTVAFESMYNCIPTAIISDFGLKNSLANYHFLDSGCMLKFNELNNTIPLVNKKWYDQMIDFPENRDQIFNELIHEVLSAKVDHNADTICSRDLEYLNFLQNNKRYSSRYKKIIGKFLNLYKKLFRA
jgi:hypothetical protein